MKKIPEPDIEDINILDILNPIERKAESFILKQLRQFFGVRAIRAYFTMIFFGYMLDQVTINIFERRFKFEINNQQEFTLYSSIYIFVIVILSFLDFRESRFFSELEQNERMWSNFIVNIQPHIEDPDMKLLAMYSFKLEKTNKDLRDYLIKIVNQHIKGLLEDVSDMDFKILELEKELEIYEPLKELVKQIQNKKR
jgi:hypothetical protein